MVANYLGFDEKECLNAVKRFIECYLTATPTGKWKPLDYKFREDNCVPVSYLLVRAQRTSCFNECKRGWKLALSSCLHVLAKEGYVVQLSGEQVVETYGYSGILFKVLV